MADRSRDPAVRTHLARRNRCRRAQRRLLERRQLGDVDALEIGLVRPEERSHGVGDPLRYLGRDQAAPKPALEPRHDRLVAFTAIERNRGDPAMAERDVEFSDR